MQTNTVTTHPITIDTPMVLIPIEEYKELLAEAGYKTTPRLTREIREARARFKKGKSIQWETLKRELK
ncbi:MAG: hypothetical protein NTX47_01345 [Candidatus Omnitrophica bacterium]|nr:hypothetical protein [Candidatus Omnitrophota bacterium]